MILENMDKNLSEFGIKNGSRLKCDDFLQEFNINVTLSQQYVRSLLVLTIDVWCEFKIT